MLKKIISSAFAVFIAVLAFATPAAAQFRSDNSREVYIGTLDSHPNQEHYLSSNPFPRGASETVRVPEGYQRLVPPAIGFGNGRVNNLPVEDHYFALRYGNRFPGRDYRGRDYYPAYSGRPYYDGRGVGIGVSAGVGVNVGLGSPYYDYNYGLPDSAHRREVKIGSKRKFKRGEMQYCEGIGNVEPGKPCDAWYYEFAARQRALGQNPALARMEPVAPPAEATRVDIVGSLPQAQPAPVQDAFAGVPLHNGATQRCVPSADGRLLICER